MFGQAAVSMSASRPAMTEDELLFQQQQHLLQQHHQPHMTNRHHLDTDRTSTQQPTDIHAHGMHHEQHYRQYLLQAQAAAAQAQAVDMSAAHQQLSSGKMQDENEDEGDNNRQTPNQTHGSTTTIQPALIQVNFMNSNYLVEKRASKMLHQKYVFLFLVNFIFKIPKTLLLSSNKNELERK